MSEANNVLYYALWAVAIYFALYLCFCLFASASTFESIVAGSLDFVVIGSVLLFVGFALFTLPSDQINRLMTESWESFLAFFQDPFSLFPTTLFLVFFYLAIWMFRIPMGESKPLSVTIVENSTWFLIILMVVQLFLKNVLKMDVGTFLKKPEEPKKATPPPPTDEVFHIADNIYTYDEAQATCRLIGAKLATYDQIEDAYMKGAEWAEYGWSEGQMAFFPTQKATWQSLQSNEKTMHNIGRPGINGGYMANKDLKFGINCYGKKPTETETDVQFREAQRAFFFPQPSSETDPVLDDKSQYLKDNTGNVLKINSFNLSKWSEY